MPSFNLIQSAFNVTVLSVEVNCVLKNIYKIKEGDTCDFITQVYGVSTIIMFYINLTIMNCSAI